MFLLLLLLLLLFISFTNPKQNSETNERGKGLPLFFFFFSCFFFFTNQQNRIIKQSKRKSGTKKKRCFFCYDNVVWLLGIRSYQPMTFTSAQTMFDKTMRCIRPIIDTTPYKSKVVDYGFSPGLGALGFPLATQDAYAAACPSLFDCILLLVYQWKII